MPEPIPDLSRDQQCHHYYSGRVPHAPDATKRAALTRCPLALQTKSTYIFFITTFIFDGEGSGVTSVSVIDFPSALSANVFSRRTFPSSPLYVTFSVCGSARFTAIVPVANF